jgi:hypothetical protein
MRRVDSIALGSNSIAIAATIVIIDVFLLAGRPRE